MDVSNAAPVHFRFYQSTKDRGCGSAEGACGRQLDRNRRNVAHVAGDRDSTDVWALAMGHLGIRLVDGRCPIVLQLESECHWATFIQISPSSHFWMAYAATTCHKIRF